MNFQNQEDLATFKEWDLEHVGGSKSEEVSFGHPKLAKLMSKRENLKSRKCFFCNFLVNAKVAM